MSLARMAVAAGVKPLAGRVAGLAPVGLILFGLTLFGLTLSGLAGCVGAGSRPLAARCSFAACGEDPASLVKVTASAVGAAPGSVTILQSERQFSGAVLVWRAAAAGRRYDCREGRDARAPTRVHYVDCRVSTDGPLKAFP